MEILSLLFIQLYAAIKYEKVNPQNTTICYILFCIINIIILLVFSFQETDRGVNVI